MPLVPIVYLAFFPPASMFTAQNFPASCKNIEEQRFSSHREGPAFMFI